MSANRGFERGLQLLRHALTDLANQPLLAQSLPTQSARAGAGTQASDHWFLASDSLLTAEAPSTAKSTRTTTGSAGNPFGDSELATSSAENEAVGTRLIALVELARNGDKEAFGQLYDHYHLSVYRFLYYRVNSTTLAEDLTAETFFRALRRMNSFRWQGKDFGAWLMTIARNLAADHFKSGRNRLEHTTEDMRTLDSSTEGPETEVLASLTNAALMEALGNLPTEQRECIIMRFLQGLSIAETAEILGRSPGAVKQLQLRGVRNLGKLLPVGEHE